MTYPVIEFTYSKPDTTKYRLLKKAHTRQLMRWLNGARTYGSSFEPDYNGTHLTIEEIKAELALREHIPNKQEAKVIRQKRAKLSKYRKGDGF